MKTIGIRVQPTAVWFAVYDNGNDAIVNVEAIKVPAAFETPDALKYVRSNLLDVIREYEVEHAGIRVTESNAQRINLERVQIEGVIQEAFASSTLTSYYIGQISSIAARLGLDRTDMKPLINGDADPGVENWSEMTDVEREAILCAKGAVTNA